MPKSLFAILLSVTLAVGGGPSLAEGLSPDLLRKKNTGGTTSQPVLRSWMSPDVKGAWDAGFRGQGTTTTVVDDFSSRSFIAGNLGTGSLRLRHGDWTAMQSAMVAPSTTVLRKDFYSGTAVGLRSGFNVLNLSYGMMAQPGLPSLNWSGQEQSIITYAQTGAAVISKAAGNDAVVIGGTNKGDRVDYLNIALVGAQSAIFVGALDRNGTQTDLAVRASYSNMPGTDTTTQNQFLMVGVEGSKTGLYGTSFAAPIVSGYAAVLSSKFTTATPTAIVDKLLSTARTDTIFGYDPSVHGKGEASLARALSPVSIN